jgi:HSP20 family protein
MLSAKRKVMDMATAKHDDSKKQVVPRRQEFFDQFLGDWSDMFRPVLFWPEHVFGTMRVEEFTEDGMLVVRAELPGLDPEKDIDISVTGDVLHIVAERRAEEKTEGRNYVRKEHRYGSFQRDFLLPKGTSQADIKASYKDGILEVRVPTPKPEVAVAKKIPITTTH